MLTLRFKDPFGRTAPLRYHRMKHDVETDTFKMRELRTVTMEILHSCRKSPTDQSRTSGPGNAGHQIA